MTQYRCIVNTITQTVHAVNVLIIIHMSYRKICCTGVTHVRIRSSALTWRRGRTERWCCPATTWTCSPYLCLRATYTGVTGQCTIFVHLHPWIPLHRNHLPLHCFCTEPTWRLIYRIYWVFDINLFYLLTLFKEPLTFVPTDKYFSFFRTHANGSIKRGSKDNATDSVSLRTGIGVQLKDIKVFNRARQQGGCYLTWLLTEMCWNTT